MKYLALLTSTLVLASQASGAMLAAAITDPPCSANTAKFSKLETCATGSRFCSSYLGNHVTLTYTSTATTTTRRTVTVTVTKVSYVTAYTGTTTVAGPPSTVTTATSTTITTTSPTCRATGDMIRRADAAPQTSCGLPSNAAPSEVSAACNCLLASNIVITETFLVYITRSHTTASTSTVEAESTVTTTPTTTYTATTTYFVCTTPPPVQFTLFESSSGDNLVVIDGEGPMYDGTVELSESDFTLFSLGSDHILRDYNTGYAAYVESVVTDSGSGNAVVFAASNPSNNAGVLCLIDNNSILQCVDTFYEFCDAPYNVTLFYNSNPGGCTAVTLTATIESTGE